MKDEMHQILTGQSLRNFVFQENEPIDTFFKSLWELRKEAAEAGNIISDADFSGIILAAFPSGNFDTIIQNITSNHSNYPSSTSIIKQITFQYTCIERYTGVIAGDHIMQAHSAVLAK